MIYKYYSNLSKHALSNFRDELLCFSHVDCFNDVQELSMSFDKDLSFQNTIGIVLDKRQEYIELQKFRIRICCFCKEDNNEHMWTKYANNSCGFCIGYNEQDLTNPWLHIALKPVVYNNNDVIITSDLTPEEAFCNQVCHKNSKWSSEHEVRSILIVQPKDMKKLQSLETEENTQSFSIVLVPKGFACFSETSDDDLFPYRAVKKNIPLHIKPRKLIIGRNCPKETESELQDIANAKHIPIIFQ